MVEAAAGVLAADVVAVLDPFIAVDLVGARLDAAAHPDEVVLRRRRRLLLELLVLLLRERHRCAGTAGCRSAWMCGA